MKTRMQQLKKAFKLMGWVYGDILSQLIYHFEERKLHNDDTTKTTTQTQTCEEKQNETY